MSPRPAQRPLRALSQAFCLSILVAASFWAVVGCASPSPVQTPVASLSGGPSLTPVPGGSNPESPPTSAGLPTQTDTEWGRIWDALPPTFPLPEGSIPTETGEGPVSGTFAVGASAEQAAELVQAGLSRAGYSIKAHSDPSEDGSVVIDAVGAAPECQVQVRLTPLSGTTHMVVMYGAACPFG